MRAEAEMCLRLENSPANWSAVSERIWAGQYDVPWWELIHSRASLTQADVPHHAALGLMWECSPLSLVDGPQFGRP